RIGWMLGAPDRIERAGHALIASAGALPLSHTRAGLWAFSNLLPLAARSRAILAGKRERVAAWVASHGLGWSAPTDGLFGLVTVPGAGDLTPTIEAAVRDREVIVAPGAFFG